MNQQILSINTKIKDLKKEKDEIKEKERVEKTKKNLEKNSYNNSHNVLSRISRRFEETLNRINEKREEIGFGSLSKPKITELIIRHKFFNSIEKDLINFNNNIEGDEYET